MGKSVIPVEYRFTAAEIAAGAADSLSGVRIVVVDSSQQPTGNVYESGAAGSAPVESSAGIKNNFAGTATPLVTDDSSKGYSIGSRFIDITNDESYICLDATVGSAVWSKSTVGTIAEIAGLQGVLDAKADNTDLTDGSVQALLDTLRADSVHFLTSASSVDTLTTTGWYNIQNATGGPSGGGWYYYFHGTHRNTATGAPDTTYGFQLAKRLDSSTTNNLLMRVKTAGTWTAWATIATTDAATTTIAGLMSAADKTKLDGVATGAAALSSTTPVMDGTAAVGTGTTSARADHVHASDTSRAPLASPTFTGTVSGITKAMVGLTNADNTADTAKPVSTAQQTALDLKADNTDITDGSIGGYFDSIKTDGVINLAAASYVEIMGYQSGGVSLNLGGTTSSATISYLGS